MPVVWTARHRGHAPDGGYWLGVRLPGDEEPERGDVLADQLRGAGVDLVEPDEHGLDPILAVHDAGFVDFLARAWPAWVAEGHLDDPGQPQVVPYLFATGRVRRPPRPPTPAGDDPRRGRAVRDGHDDADQRGHVRRRVRRRRLRRHRRRPRPRRRAGGVRRRPAARSPRRAGVLRRLVLPQQRRRRRPAPPRRRGRARRRSSTSTPTRATAPRRSSTTAADVLYASVHVDPAAGWFPHLVGHADETGAGDGAGCNRNVVVAARDRRRARGSPRSTACSTTCGRSTPTPLVVSLGVDAAADDPESPLLITAGGYRAAGRAPRRPRPADGARPGGRLPPPDARRARARRARRASSVADRQVGGG